MGRRKLGYTGQPGELAAPPPTGDRELRVSWSQITDVPVSFPPARHEHATDDIPTLASAAVSAVLRVLGRVTAMQYCREGVWEQRGPAGALAGRTDVTVIWVPLTPSDPAPLTGGPYAVAGHDLWLAPTSGGGLRLVPANPVTMGRTDFAPQSLTWDVQRAVDPGRVAFTPQSLAWDVQRTVGSRFVFAAQPLAWDVQRTTTPPADPTGQWVTLTRTANYLTLSETGWHNAMDTTSGHKPTPPDVSAVALPRALAEYAALERMPGKLPMVRVAFYKLRDSGVSNTDEQQRFGLLNLDASPKRHFTALKDWHTVLDRGLTGTLPTTPPKLNVTVTGSGARSLLYYGAPGSGERARHYLLLWRDDAASWGWNPDTQTATAVAGRNLTVTFGSAKTVRVFSPSAGPSQVSTSTGSSVTLSVADKLLILEIASTDSVDTTGSAGSSIANLRWMAAIVHKVGEDSDTEWTQNLARIRESGVKTIRARYYKTAAMATRVKALRDIGVKVMLTMGTPTSETDTPTALLAATKANGLHTYRGDGCILLWLGANEWNHYGPDDFDEAMAQLLAHTQDCWTRITADSAFDHIPFVSPSVGLRHTPTYNFLSRHTDLWHNADVHLYQGGYKPNARVFDSPVPQYPLWASIS